MLCAVISGIPGVFLYVFFKLDGMVPVLVSVFCVWFFITLGMPQYTGKEKLWLVWFLLKAKLREGMEEYYDWQLTRLTQRLNTILDIRKERSVYDSEEGLSGIARSGSAPGRLGIRSENEPVVQSEDWEKAQ